MEGTRAGTIFQLYWYIAIFTVMITVCSVINMQLVCLVGDYSFLLVLCIKFCRCYNFVCSSFTSLVSLLTIVCWPPIPHLHCLVNYSQSAVLKINQYGYWETWYRPSSIEGTHLWTFHIRKVLIALSLPYKEGMSLTVSQGFCITLYHANSTLHSTIQCVCHLVAQAICFLFRQVWFHAWCWIAMCCNNVIKDLMHVNVVILLKSSSPSTGQNHL